MENKMSGGGKSGTPVKEVMTVIFMMLEKNPNIGPVLRQYKQEIEDAIFKEITKSP